MTQKNIKLLNTACLALQTSQDLKLLRKDVIYTLDKPFYFKTGTIYFSCLEERRFALKL